MQAPGQVQRGSGEGSGGSRVCAEPGQVQQASGKGSGVGGSGAEPGQVQQGSGEGSGEGLGGFGAEPGQVQQDSGEGSGEGLGGFGATGSGEGSGEGPGAGFRRRFWRRFREALVQSQVRFNRRRFQRRSGRLWCRARSGSTGFREKILEKGPGSLGAEPSQVQRVPEKVAEKVLEKVLGILGAGPGQVQQVQQGFQRLALQHASERFVNIRLRVLGIPPKLIFQSTSNLQDFTLVSPLFFPQSPKTVGERSKCKLIYI